MVSPNGATKSASISRSVHRRASPRTIPQFTKLRRADRPPPVEQRPRTPHRRSAAAPAIGSAQAALRRRQVRQPNEGAADAATGGEATVSRPHPIVERRPPGRPRASRSRAPISSLRSVAEPGPNSCLPARYQSANAQVETRQPDGIVPTFAPHLTGRTAGARHGAATGVSIDTLAPQCSADREAILHKKGRHRRPFSFLKDRDRQLTRDVRMHDDLLLLASREVRHYVRLAHHGLQQYRRAA